MKTEGFVDQSLKAWVLEYTDGKLQEHRKSPARIEQLKSAWGSWNEADWRAFREVRALRARCEEKALDRTAHETIVSRYLERLPPIERNGIRYAAPYSLGAEVAALRDHLFEGVPRVTVDFVP